ncbi:MAG: efflux RND transporter permease subunit, partial [Planctomycetota bacterium]|jgi:multidrug efflux pump subunit AcrB
MPAIGLGISTVKGGNVVVMGQAVDQRLKELESETPIGIEMGVVSHQGDSVVTAIDMFVISLIEAVAIVVGILIFAMGLRSGILIGGILVLTIFATFIAMKTQGVMLERISLGALIIALGMLVDNAIVVVEGIIINIKKGMGKVEAASSIVRQTIWPLFGATVVAVLAFAAIGASNDSTGEFCRSLFLVILYSLTLSWVLAVTLTPLYGVMFLKVKTQGEEEDSYKGTLYQIYKKFLIFCIRFRIITITVLVALLVLSVYGFGFVDKTFFPDSTRPQFMVHYWLPQGIQITETEKEVKEIADYLLKQYEEITDVAAVVGQGALRFLLTYAPEETNSGYAIMLVSVDDYKKIPKLMQEIESYLNTSNPDAQAYCRRFALGPGDPFKIQARLRGPNPDELRRLAKQVEQIMLDDPEAEDVSTDWRQRVPLIRPVVAEAQARNAGLTHWHIARGIQYATEGRTVGYYREKDDLLPIIVRSPEAERADVADLENAQIYSPAALASIPLQQVLVGFETVSENQIIRRRDGLPTLTIRCNAKDAPSSTVFEKLRQKIEAVPLPPGYDLQWGGEYEDSGKARKALMAKMPVIAILMALTVIILFDSVRKPLIIFLTVPLAVIGVTVGLLFTGQPFGFMALLGFLSLSGMLIKNSIVLIDEINVQLASGKDRFQAVVDSSVSRARPVSMAAATTVLGMIPLLTDAFFVSMAITIMVGLAFATILTLIVVPVLFTCFFKIPSPGS